MELWESEDSWRSRFGRGDRHGRHRFTESNSAGDLCPEGQSAAELERSLRHLPGLRVELRGSDLWSRLDLPNVGINVVPFTSAENASPMLSWLFSLIVCFEVLVAKVKMGIFHFGGTLGRVGGGFEKHPQQ